MGLDKIDRQILDILQENGRISNAELARRINMSPPPTLERVKKLERHGIIQNYVALANPAKLGLNCFTYVEVTLVRHGREGVERFMKSITSLDEVMECHHITGGADFLLKVASQDIPDYENFVLHKLTALPEVQHLKTMVVLSTLKHETRMPTDLNTQDSK
ncbi:MAG: Lrp/AsnC family transcriptional regulator [Candidatus Marinimicrobia bacterium]|jgi:DNA-binding Lrp family transcriptional regulator|nr:Lrp/AsnC family transcriptional regulator [Candidatus Neomarinimicrobiota bacterium]MBT3576781.1 Lrp/AsnC family transcriptional regulator [Candidatus Neomarinimicrobiota bacterium]MBT3678989.1 Lrp/AsnC family transcriptional regulator [Candidatus Neomarinimicrobiota bacterium]MBT3950246.1 Lrp/AsnC family transcriptional regulator [Candidatus Neomarinimicrobiota bacterium]MBT4252140.1 Lrp/AsnC family transcriptional regulator [Candidatus Neomarinimicrobiota bacterium]